MLKSLLHYWLLRAFGRAAVVLIPVLVGLIGGVLLIAPGLSNGPQVVFMSNRSFNWDMYMLDLRTGALAQLTNTPYSDERYPAWSPDGERIAYHANYSPEPSYSDFNVHIMDADGTGLTSIWMSQDVLFFDEAMPAWSPDGERLIFHSGRDNFFNLFVSDLDGVDYRAITAGDGAFYHASWSPDGTQLAFVMTVDQESSIYTLDISDGYLDIESNLVNMQVLVEGAFFPAWSPDGTRIAYVSEADGDEDIYVIDITTGDIQQLTNNSDASDTQPEWTSDGTHIIFSSNADGRYHLYQIHADGSQLRQLTFAPFTDDLAPDWRP
jgi:Tol biopolymer transport system component